MMCSSIIKKQIMRGQYLK